MNRIEQIKAEQKKLADELEGEMLKERANVLGRMKEDIKLFGFKTSVNSAPNKNKHLQEV
jgi:hypothetical protein